MNKQLLVIAVSFLQCSLIAMKNDTSWAKVDADLKRIMQEQAALTRKNNGCDLTQLPALFDEDTNGPIATIHTNEEETIVRTFWDGMYVYDTHEATWSWINSARFEGLKYEDIIQAMRQPYIEHGAEYFTKNGTWAAQKPIHPLKYNKQSKVLLCVLNDRNVWREVQLTTPDHHYDLRAIGKSVEAAAFSKDGKWGAYSWFSDDWVSKGGSSSLLEVWDSQLALVTVPNSEHTLMLTVFCVENINKYADQPLFFDDNNNVHLLNIDARQRLIHTIVTTPQNSISHHTCLLDVGQKEPIAMGFIKRYSGLLAQLKNSEYKSRLSPQLQAIANMASYCIHESYNCTVPWDVMHNIMSMYRAVACDQISEGLNLIYGASFTPQEQQSAALLADIHQKYDFMNIGVYLSEHKIKDQEIFDAIKRSIVWQKEPDRNFGYWRFR